MRRKRHYRRKRKGVNEDNSIRLLILSFLILLAVIFKTVTGVSTVTVFKEFSAAVLGEQSYNDAISTLGKAISEGTKENAVAVFGKRIIGAKEISEPSTELPVVNETPKETEENTKGRATAVPAFNNETNITFVDFKVNEEEYLDDTPDEPFEVPAPDGVDDAEYALPFEYTRPCKGRVTSPFGYRVHPITEETTFHRGVDLAAENGTAILAFAGGKVIECGNDTVYGKYVKVQHESGFLTFYAHLSGFGVKEGETIKMGEAVGKAGATGLATGPHLHFEIRKDGKVIDPSQYIQ